MRVHELAKELGLPSKEVVGKLKAIGADASSHMSTVDDATAERLRLSIKAPPVEAKAVPAAKTKAPPAAPKAADRPVHAPKAAQSKPQVTPAAPAKKVITPTPVVETPKAAAEVPQTAKAATIAPADDKTIALRGAIVVKELAEKLKLKPNQLVAELMAMNVFASISDRIDIKDAQKVALKHGITLEHEKRSAEPKPAVKAWDEEDLTDNPEDLETRPPIVTFLGHVDHGKTSLLDRIRKTMVAKGEAGGITQCIGAYMADVHGRRITFLDTPGHAAFTGMRARGANLTDIAVIIVAADDGVMPQTIEAIQHAKAAHACVMVAINKIDLPNAGIDRVKKQLQGLDVAPEEWGGTTICCEVSATTGAGIDHLLEMILLQADMLDLKASRKRRADGYVVEAQLEAGMGPTATLLVKRGCLKVGDMIICGPHFGRIKALINERGVRMRTADPSTPIKCLGLSGVPEAGAYFTVCADEKIARAVSGERNAELKAKQVVVPRKASLDSLYKSQKSTASMELRLIVKADVQGSVEAIRHALDAIKSEKASLKLILCGVGNITVNDTLLASASDAVVVGFNVSKEDGVNATAKKEGVEIRLHSIIYDLVDEIRASMTGLLAPQLKETIIGRATVLEVFAISKLGNVAGCMITAGRVSSRSKARVSRKGGIIYDGALSSLRRFQNEAAEAKESQECGIRLDNFSAFEKGDTLEFYEVTKIAQVL